LQDRVEKAQTLRDDIAFMTERADSMAGRLEASVRSARDDVRPIMPSAPAAQGRAPRAPRATSPDAVPAAEPFTSRAGDGTEDDRSEAERELLRALQAVR
jgi:hypothetical protein